jgi:hypothetical protein
MQSRLYTADKSSRNDAEHLAALTERAFSVVQAVSESSSRAAYLAARSAKRSALRLWRKQNGPFVAQETGTLYKREINAYDQKPREKPARQAVPLTASEATRQQANLRDDLKKPVGHPDRSATLEGIYHWLAEYAKLTPEQKAELEESVKSGKANNAMADGGKVEAEGKENA